MQLRKLDVHDLPLMKSWIKDDEIAYMYMYDLVNRTDAEIIDFIKSCRNEHDNRYYAIASDTNEYMGTVCLGHIENYTAELAIIVRKEARKRGYAWFGMEEIIRVAFDKLGLESIYWCVSETDQRAIRFCEKHNFHGIKDVPQAALQRYKDVDNLRWYSVLKGDNLKTKESVAGCKVIHINTIPTVNAGELSFFEASHEIPFDIKRIYYITKVPEGVRRGFHAHKELKQILFCPYGRIQLVLENEFGREEIELSDPSIGVVIEKPTWREMLWLQKDSVLCVAASEFYNVEDYIREYDKFKTFMRRGDIGDE